MANHEVRQIVKQLERQGWRIEETKKHIKCFPPEPDRPMVVIASTPGGGRWRQNAVAQLRRSGADI